MVYPLLDDDDDSFVGDTTTLVGLVYTLAKGFSLANEVHEKAPGDTLPVTLDVTAQLDEDQTLTSTPTVVSVTSNRVEDEDELEAEVEGVNTTAIEENGVCIEERKSVQITLTEGTAGTIYTVLIGLTCSGGQYLVRGFKVIVR
jgi:hypothetical protein